MRMTAELELMLKMLGYTPEWFDLGVISEESLRAQYAEYISSDDKNQEHYRARAFEAFLFAHRALTDDQVEQVLRLKDDGPDGCDLRIGRISGMIWSGVLSDTQMADLAQLTEIHESPLQRGYVRECMLRRLRSEGLTSNVFRAIVDSGDSELQRVILSRGDLCRDHVVWLTEHGANKAVRNIARQLLQSHSLREKPDDAKT
jgi:hypothetical protein